MKTYAGMMIILVVVALSIIAALALVPVTVSGKDNGRTIDMLRFRTIKLTLESNPTTGYGWQLISPPDRKVLRKYYSVFRRPDLKLVGAGGYEEFKFRAMAPGIAVIKLIYVRPWEKEASPAREFTLTVRVR